MKKNNSILSHVLLFLIILILPSCLDTDPPNNDKMKSPQFVSGPENSVAYPFAKGIIDAADEILGIFMNNQLTNGSVENGTKLVNEEAYLGLVQEDIFYYSRNKYLSQFNADPDNAEIKYLKIASQLKVIMSTYKKDLYLLINTDNLGTGITIDDIKTTDTLEINLGIEDSDNYISAKTVFDAHSFITTNIHTDAPETGIQKVISGEYDAAFLISETYPAPALQSIQADAPVELIRVYMPEDKKYYDEDGVIFNDDYLFVDNSIEKNITVRTLIVAGPFFSDSSIEVFIDYALDHTVEYKTFNQEWGRITNINSREYMMKNPLKCNYRALCHVTGYTLLDPFYVESYFCSGAAEGAYHDMTIELIWLLSHNLDIDLKEKNTTGTWENSYWMLNGNGTMALVQDDIYSNLINDEGETYSIMQAASMRKVAPLHYEYVHLVVNTEAANWSSWNFNGSNDDPSQLTGDYLEQIFTDPSPAVTTAPVLHINVGPKTSGTYISAMKIINSYKKMNKSSADDPDLPDMDGIEIHYHFDSPSDSILKVDTGEYHMAFVTSGVPYHRFYSHDTYSLPENIALIPARFYDADNDGAHLDNTPSPYREGIIAGGGTAVFENYPYPSDILATDITTVRVRSNLVTLPVFDDSYINKYIKAIFRKTYYKIFPFDPDDPDFAPDPLWMPIVMESYEEDDPFYDYDAVGMDYGTYSETIVGAKEYFVMNPFGWTDEAVEYYLMMFPNN